MRSKSNFWKRRRRGCIRSGLSICGSPGMRIRRLWMVCRRGGLISRFQTFLVLLGGVTFTPPNLNIGEKNNDFLGIIMKIKKCPNCKSEHIIHTRKEIYCHECGLVLAGTTKYVGIAKVYYPFGLIFG